MERDDEIDSMAEAIVGSAKKTGSGLEEGSDPALAEEDPGELAATEEILEAFNVGDPSALNRALKNHYAICNK